MPTQVNSARFYRAKIQRLGRGPREVSEFKPSAEARLRAAGLLERESNAGLTSAERRELDHYEDLGLLMNLAKARARQLLAHGQ